ncbi:ribosomal protein S18 acetylase RimI-like enzyme [Methylobacterium sp. BE186]|uniref:GNAT family N-acetyltransferase n=1 Tax=Methylobacterium sp. BE186 TaxID=2817715 RepID=UPI0028587B16|nr:GNAT family N-acetyltransferase [Methylobacterium sp. BE186]MDR7037297.1 ribosomal protein S18 acetylase RimI-like enzyme [Methylobacterium sp. BE186]
MLIRFIEGADQDAVWEILRPVIEAGETYALPRDMTRAEALAYWSGPDRETFVAEDRGALVGTAYLRANQAGGGSHVANAGFVTAPAAAGRGVARRMCEHVLERARERGFAAMQFNFVIGTNAGAIRLWESLGFETVGRLPGAFRHPRLGAVDALVMYRRL